MITPEFQEDKKIKAAMHNLYCSIESIFKKYQNISLIRSENSNDSDTNYEKFIGISLIKEGQEYATVNVPILSKSVELNNTDEKYSNPLGYFATNKRVDEEVTAIKDPNAAFIMENNLVKEAFEKEKDREYFDRDGVKVEKVLSENDLTDEFKAQYDEAYSKYVKSGVVLSDKEKVTLKFTRNDGTTFDVVIKDEYITTSDEEVHITNLGFDIDNGKLTATVKTWDDVAKKVVEQSLSTSLDGRYSLLGHSHPISDIINLATELNSLREKDNTIGTDLNLHNDKLTLLEKNYKNQQKQIDNKVDKVEGMGLSHNDLTDEKLNYLYTAYNNFIESGNITYDKEDDAYIFNFTRNDGTYLTIPFNIFKNELRKPIVDIDWIPEDGNLKMINSKGEEYKINFDGRYSLLEHNHSISEIDNLQPTIDNINNKISSNTNLINSNNNSNNERLTSIESELRNKVSKIEGKGLSQNDYTDAEKAQVLANKNATIVSGNVVNSFNGDYLCLTRADDYLIYIKLPNKSEDLNTFLSKVEYVKATNEELVFTLNNNTKYKVDLTQYLSKKDHTHTINQIADLQSELTNLQNQITANTNSINSSNSNAINTNNQVKELQDSINTINTKNQSQDQSIQANATSINNLIPKVNNLETKVNNLETNKVDKVEGKGLSTNDYSNADKALLQSAVNKVVKSIAFNDNELVLTFTDNTTLKASYTQDSETLALNPTFDYANDTVKLNNTLTIPLKDQTGNRRYLIKSDLNAEIQKLTNSINTVKSDLVNQINTASSSDMYLLTQNTFNITEAIVSKFHIGKNLSDNKTIKVMTFINTLDSDVTFTTTSPYTLVKVDGTNVLKGIGSTATVIVYENKIYLRISDHA